MEEDKANQTWTCRMFLTAAGPCGKEKPLWPTVKALDLVIVVETQITVAGCSFLILVAEQTQWAFMIDAFTATGSTRSSQGVRLEYIKYDIYHLILYFILLDDELHVKLLLLMPCYLYNRHKVQCLIYFLQPKYNFQPSPAAEATMTYHDRSSCSSLRHRKHTVSVH